MRFIVAAMMLLACCPCFGQAKKTKATKVVTLAFDPAEKVKAHIKENCNDPEKLSFVAIGKPINSAECLIFSKGSYPEDGRSLAVAWGPMPSGIVVGAKYRTANVVGAIVLTEKAFLLDPEGRVLAEYAGRDIRMDTKGLNNTDPFADVFLNQFK